MTDETTSQDSLSRKVNSRQRGTFIKNLGDFQTELATRKIGVLPLADAVISHGFRRLDSDPRIVEQVRADAHNWRATVLAWTYKLAAAAMR